MKGSDQFLDLALVLPGKAPDDSLMGVPVALTAAMEALENRKDCWLCRSLKASPSVS